MKVDKLPFGENALILQTREAIATLKREKVNQRNLAKQFPSEWNLFAPKTQIISGSKLVNFRPYEYQTILSKIVDTFPVVVCVKVRQIGFTEFMLSKLLHNAVLNRGFSAACFSLKDEDAADCSKRARLMLKSLDLATTNQNVGEITIKNAGSIFFKGSSPQGSRGRALSSLFFDEAAFNSNISEISSASSACLTHTENSSKIWASTPSGTDNFWYESVLTSDDPTNIIDLCKEVASGEASTHGIEGFYDYSPPDNPEIRKVICHWKSVPKFKALDEKLKSEGKGGYLEYVRLKNSLDQKTLLQDYDLCFLSSDQNVFSVSLIENTFQGEWEEPIKERRNFRYIAACDSSSTGNNFFIFSLIRESLIDGSLSLVAWYKNRRQSLEYNVYHCSQLIQKYRPEKTIIEKNHIGQAVLERLIQIHPQDDIQGITTGENNKPLMIGRLLSAMERGLLKLPPDKGLKKEFLNYLQQKSTGSYGASQGNFDDGVMSIALALCVSNLSEIEERRYGFEMDEEIMEILRGDNY